MNKDIQTLIEREAKEYSERIKKNTSFNSNERIDATAGFKRGASIISESITNLFKWRKVSEEPIPIEQIVVLRLGDNYTVMIISDEEIAEYAKIKFKDAEWMPIPQID